MTKIFKKAFTLIELVVVIAIIAILSGVSIGTYFGVTISANHSKNEQETLSISNLFVANAKLYKGNDRYYTYYNDDGLIVSEVNDTIICDILGEGYTSENISVYSSDKNENTKYLDFDHNKNALIFFVNYYNNESEYLIKYIGYLSKNLSTDYIKYFSLEKNSLIDSFDGEYINFDDLNKYVSRLDLSNIIDNESYAYAYYKYFSDQKDLIYGLSITNKITNLNSYSNIKSIEVELDDSLINETIYIYGMNEASSSCDMSDKTGATEIIHYNELYKDTFKGGKFIYNFKDDEIYKFFVFKISKYNVSNIKSFVVKYDKFKDESTYTLRDSVYFLLDDYYENGPSIYKDNKKNIMLPDFFMTFDFKDNICNILKVEVNCSDDLKIKELYYKLNYIMLNIGPNTSYDKTNEYVVNIKVAFEHDIIMNYEFIYENNFAV